jgi:hypothetical protein
MVAEIRGECDDVACDNSDDTIVWLGQDHLGLD